MRFLIVSHTPHVADEGKLYAYAPYVREMNLWIKYADKVVIIAPRQKTLSLSQHYEGNQLIWNVVPAIALTSLLNTLRTILILPYLFLKLVGAMHSADHIHLRCPGNLGLLGCIVQSFFPSKKKTVKYAGNWDPNAEQPWSYRLQKAILSNDLLTKNATVLVYGAWPEQPPAIKSFFTATYTEEDKLEVPQRRYDLPLRFLFVGTLTSGKRPLYAIELVNELIKSEIPCELNIYGDGPMYEKIKSRIEILSLNKFVYLQGNQPRSEVDQAYKKSHFLILPSRSEGWPKVVAEAMWWGVIPVSSPVSCLPWMLGEGSRGILLKMKLKKDVRKLRKDIENKNALRTKSYKAMLWSRKYSMEHFEKEIRKLL